MREGTPSGTSFLVSFARGLGVDAHSLDPLASKWLPRRLGLLVDAPMHLGSAARWYRRAIRAASFGMVDHVVLRTAVIDAKLSEAVMSEIDQIVILGAGLDARAWRMPILADKKVYEVDHPSTQEFKRSRIGDAIPPADVRYVAVDLEQESFSSALLHAEFEPSKPTAWVWEGVAMYLPVDAVVESLSQMTELSSAGSALLMTYRVPDALPFGRFGMVTIPLVFSLGGEPLGMTLEPHELEVALAPAWKVLYDEDAKDWRTFTESPADSQRSFRSERFAFARRES